MNLYKPAPDKPVPIVFEVSVPPMKKTSTFKMFSVFLRCIYNTVIGNDLRANALHRDFLRYEADNAIAKVQARERKNIRVCYKHSNRERFDYVSNAKQMRFSQIKVLYIQLMRVATGSLAIDANPVLQHLFTNCTKISHIVPTATYYCDAILDTILIHHRPYSKSAEITQTDFGALVYVPLMENIHRLTANAEDLAYYEAFIECNKRPPDTGIHIYTQDTLRSNQLNNLMDALDQLEVTAFVNNGLFDLCKTREEFIATAEHALYLVRLKMADALKSKVDLELTDMARRQASKYGLIRMMTGAVDSSTTNRPPLTYYDYELGTVHRASANGMEGVVEYLEW